MSADIWSCNPDVAQAVSETAGMPRAALMARLDYLAAGLSDEDLRAIVVAAMALPQRPLDGTTLAEAQRQRESAASA